MWFWIKGRLLKIVSVQLLRTPQAATDPSPPALVFDLKDVTQPMTTTEGALPNVLEIKFDQPVNVATVIDGMTFLVAKEPSGLTPGGITAAGPHTIRRSLKNCRLT